MGTRSKSSNGKSTLAEMAREGNLQQNFKKVFNNESDQDSYESKKTAGQAMLDIALLADNAKNIKYTLQNATNLENFSILISLLATSILLQFGILIVSGYLLSINLCDKDGKFKTDCADVKRGHQLTRVSGYLAGLLTVTTLLINVFGFEEKDETFKF